MQVSVLAISDKSSAYAAEIAEKLKKSRIRTSLNISDRTLDYKIREVKNLEIPYAVIVGTKEQEAKTISVRDREGKQTQGLKIEAFIELLQKEISERENRLTVLHKLDKT
jgi:threonyl-tRNA synthetase